MATKHKFDLSGLKLKPPDQTELKPSNKPDKTSIEPDISDSEDESPQLSVPNQVTNQILTTANSNPISGVTPQKSMFRSVIVPLDSITKNPETNIPLILDYVSSAHTIVSLGYQLIRLYLITTYQRGGVLPVPNDDFCKAALSVICNPNLTPGEANLHRATLKDFYHAENFGQFIPKGLKFKSVRLSTVLVKLAEEIATAIKNNITVHFRARLKQMAIHLIKADDRFAKLSKGQIRRGAAIIIAGLWEKDASAVKPHLKVIYDELLTNYIPVQDYAEGVLGYDVEANWMRYLPLTLKMSDYLERHKLKQFQAISLRTSNVPCHIPIDGNTLINLFDCNVAMDCTKQYLKDNYKNPKVEYDLWGNYFHIDRQVFNPKDGYEFCHSISTDGVSCSLTFIRTDQKHLYQNLWQPGKASTKKEYANLTKAYKLHVEGKTNQLNKTIDKFTDAEKQQLMKKCESDAGVDPGVGVIIQVADEQNRQVKYTKRQRYQECYFTKNQKTKQKMRTKAGIIELERPLNDCNSSSVNPEVFKKFISTKNTVTVAVRNHYAKIAYRNMNLRSHIHTIKSEDRLIKQLIDVFGLGCLLFYGNWSRNSNMKMGASVPGMRMKKLIAKYFGVASTHEAYTSCICYVNGVPVENKVITTPANKARSIHRCLICNECHSLRKQSEIRPSEIRRYMNRDINGARNILTIGRSELRNQGRPQAFQRESLQRDHGEDPFGEDPRDVPQPNTTPVILESKVV